MGAAASILGKKLTREQLLKSTEPMRLLMDEAMRLMMEKLTRDDFRKLREPGECAKYIVLIGNAFDQYFQSIDVIPLLKKEQKGRTTVYFQRADVLTGARSTGDKVTDEKLRTDRVQICNTIAYFFTRFFQILNALSYSVFDNAQSMTAAAPLPIGGPVLLRGGAPQELSERPLDLFAPYVFYERTDTAGMRYYRFAGIQNAVMIMKIGENEPLMFTYRGMGDDNVMTLFCTISTRGDSYILNIGRARIRIGGDVFEPSLKKYESKFARLDFRKMRNKYTTVRKIYRDDKIELVPKIMESLFIYIYNNRTNIKNNVPADSLPLFWGSVRAEPEGADTLAPLAAAAPLQKPQGAQLPKPLAHCIARSLQLLQMDIAGPLGGRGAWSYVCEPRFIAGLPLPGQSITASPGIKSLDMLFTVFNDGIPAAMTKEHREYLDALERMSALYVPEEEVPVGMDGIRNKRDAARCAIKRGPIAITDKKQLGILTNGVQALWNIQLEHARKVAAILGQLFVKDGKTGQLKINPQILQVGVVGLDMIAATARTMLLDYYTRCEATFQGAADAAGLKN